MPTTMDSYPSTPYSIGQTTPSLKRQREWPCFSQSKYSKYHQSVPAAPDRRLFAAASASRCPCCVCNVDNVHSSKSLLFTELHARFTENDLYCLANTKGNSYFNKDSQDLTSSLSIMESKTFVSVV